MAEEYPQIRAVNRMPSHPIGGTTGAPCLMTATASSAA
ncbi:Uncharacterised protein [Mycobacteroides abscessus subsp. abscessus]|nr:Uncharacterised protein [Mycobacteroides abscessus subsp. abscessus]